VAYADLLPACAVATARSTRTSQGTGTQYAVFYDGSKPDHGLAYGADATGRSCWTTRGQWLSGHNPRTSPSTRVGRSTLPTCRARRSSAAWRRRRAWSVCAQTNRW